MQSQASEQNTCPTENIYTVAVRELCEFAAKQGDLDLRFTPSPSAQEGIAGHQLVAARRGSSYCAEVPLTGRYQELVVRGRADGFDAERGLLEECKTFRGDLGRMPANHRALHWAQAKVYAWLLCQQHNLDSLAVSLVYFEIETQKETPFLIQQTALELRDFFEALCQRFLIWAKDELEHRRHRDQALRLLTFPHPDFRTGQRQMATSVFRAARHGRWLMVQAPTGIGKTLATLFPLLKAAPEQRLDKIFFLSAKGTGRDLALRTIDTVCQHATGLPLRTLELVAREKACEHPDKACHGESCPLAQGFYDRLPAARAAAVSNITLTRKTVREIALSHQLCPYYLSQELVRWSDVIVGDYNYYFDSSALLHSLTLSNGWRVAVLIDEAHNLVDRGRAMYSAQLSQSEFRLLRPAAPQSLKSSFGQLNRAWNAISKAQPGSYQASNQIPAPLLRALLSVTKAFNDLLADSAAPLPPALLNFYFEIASFNRLAETFGDHSIFDVQVETGRPDRLHRRNATSLSIRNVVPASFLKPRFQTAHTGVLFSATLTPTTFYTNSLGLPEQAVAVEVASPFAASQLRVQLVSDISTRFHQRETSLEPIADLIALQYSQNPGNYLAFFSSFEYLQNISEILSLRHPLIPQFQQSRRMDESDRIRFLQQFTTESCGVGFAVLGGVFAEGIDLPGSRLIGAFIATLGMPQFNPVNEQMKRRIDETLGKGKGYNYIYLYPGLRKVIQAAGRVIRTTSDQGCLYLIDDRFNRPEVRELLPDWWAIRS